MPDKPLTVFTYAASASLAAVALVYFFHPSYLFDNDAVTYSASSRKRGIVGLYNPANDCFINCGLQSLAGLGDLRIYLIREIHRRALVDSDVYENVPERDKDGRPVNVQKLRSLQRGDVTKGLKEMIDRLNERPIYKKTISAGPFIGVLEHAFGSTISKTQQDAQEFLQLVAERLCEEYHAGSKARKNLAGRSEPAERNNEKEVTEQLDLREDGFPLEGKTETKVECEHCHFIPKSTPTSFVMLNLMVPHRASSTLNDCFDAHFKREYIDDYKCDRCRLTHALDSYKAKRAGSDTEMFAIQSQIQMIESAIATDPEKLPEELVLPDIKMAPKRKISKYVEITSFPKILVIHLSRSIYERNSYSMKNSARVSFPERFPVGGILHRREYKLLGVVTHKGTHNSGHYETFRRQHSYLPYSNPHVDKEAGPYSARQTPFSTPSASPSMQPTSAASTSDAISAPQEGESSTTMSSQTSGTHSEPSTQPSSAVDEGAEVGDKDPSKPLPARSQDHSVRTSSQKHPTSASFGQSVSRSTSLKDSAGRLRRKKKPEDRWWRISDDKIKECKTLEVLNQTREVYMLFYEMELRMG